MSAVTGRYYPCEGCRFLREPKGGWEQQHDYVECGWWDRDLPVMGHPVLTATPRVGVFGGMPMPEHIQRQITPKPCPVREPQEEVRNDPPEPTDKRHPQSR